MDACGNQQIPGQQFPRQPFGGLHFPVRHSYTWPKRYAKSHSFPSGLPPIYPFSYLQNPSRHAIASYPSLSNYAPSSFPIKYTPLGRCPGYHSIPRIDHISGAYNEPFMGVPITNLADGKKAILTGEFHSNTEEDTTKLKQSKSCSKNCELSRRPSLIKWKARRTKQQKEICQKVLIILLTELSLCIVFACAFRFGMTEELRDINEKYPWFKWLSFAFYCVCCLILGLAPTAIHQHKYIGYIILAALTYSFCFGIGWIASFHYWEAIFTLVCFAVTTIILIMLTYALDFDEVISLVGFSLAQAILLIFFGFLTLLLKYAYYIEIHTLLIVYLITLFFPMYVIFDIWMILNGWRYSKPPTDNVLSAIITLLTDLVMYPCLLISYFTKKRCFLVYVKPHTPLENEAVFL